MSAPKFALGIDLGTSNCAMSVCDLATDDLRMVDIAQCLAPNKFGGRETLPSATYLAHAEEFSDGATSPPWGGDGRAVGHFAREHGAKVPDRLVLSAKSWLSNPRCDPKSKALPFMADLPEEEKISAFEASVGYLTHLREAFLANERERGNDWAIDEGLIVLTVPASFDENARRLTLEAAEAAGFGEVVLLEEPQAAFYAWTAQDYGTWSSQVAAGDCVLVCDLGGGTADFSLIVMKDDGGELRMERVSVGEHLLLGGDNMDIGLAYSVRAQLEAEGKTLDDWQFQALTHACRGAKVKLLSDPSLAEVALAIPSRGASLIGGSISTKLDRATLEGMVLDGFFPILPITEQPATASAGLGEIGLPYASDPVISKHIARFLTRSLENVKANPELAAALRPEALEGEFLRPDAVLFNGGVFKAESVRGRCLELLGGWAGGDAPRALDGFQLDLAVALGACYYGRNRATGDGIRIKAGTARSYYIGLESSMPAIPGFKPPVKALCVVPQGMEEGSELVIDDREFALTTGQEATFRFFMSEVRSGDVHGMVLANAERDLEETAVLNVTLPVGGDGVVPVKIQSVVTELGNLELWMKHTGSDQRWKLDLEIGGRS